MVLQLVHRALLERRGVGDSTRPGHRKHAQQGHQYHEPRGAGDPAQDSPQTVDLPGFDSLVLATGRSEADPSTEEPQDPEEQEGAGANETRRPARDAPSRPDDRQRRCARVLTQLAHEMAGRLIPRRSVRRTSAVRVISPAYSRPSRETRHLLLERPPGGGRGGYTSRVRFEWDPGLRMGGK